MPSASFDDATNVTPIPRARESVPAANTVRPQLGNGWIGAYVSVRGSHVARRREGLPFWLLLRPAARPVLANKARTGINSRPLCPVSRRVVGFVEDDCIFNTALAYGMPHETGRGPEQP